MAITRAAEDFAPAGLVQFALLSQRFLHLLEFEEHKLVVRVSVAVVPAGYLGSDKGSSSNVGARTPQGTQVLHPRDPLRAANAASRERIGWR